MAKIAVQVCYRVNQKVYYLVQNGSKTVKVPAIVTSVIGDDSSSLFANPECYEITITGGKSMAYRKGNKLTTGPMFLESRR